jgi:hypothetical protein
MLVTCEACGRSYARVLLNARANCRCGAPLLLGPEPRFVDGDALHEEERRLGELAREADKLAFLIVATDCARVDVDIARAALRRRAAKLFPDKMDVFEMVYESRFRRLWEQFRAA